MTPVFRLSFADVAYFVPTILIINHRAKYLHESFPSEYPTIKEAVTGTVKLFESDDEVWAWMKNNMTWADLRNVARLAAVLPGDRGLHMAGVEFITASETVADFKGADADPMRMPLGLIMTELEAKNSNHTYMRLKRSDEIEIGISVVVAESSEVNLFEQAIKDIAEKMGQEASAPTTPPDNADRRANYRH